MDNQDQKRTHTPGHENHGVHVCHKCGWPFPNPHPSAKQRRAHKKICGTIEGNKVGISERQTHLNGSDDERVSDEDHKTPGSNNEKGNDGIGKKLIRSEDEVFSDAVADFSDSGRSPGVKDPLQQDSLDSVTDVERVNTKEQNLSGSSEHNDFNGIIRFTSADASPLIVKSNDDSQIKNPKNLQSESVEVGNIVGIQSQLSGSTVDPLTSSVADLRSEELSIMHSDDLSGLSSDSSPSKAEAMPDVLPEKKIYAGENATDCSLICVEEESNLKGKNEVESERDTVEYLDSSDSILGEACEGVSKIAVSDAVSLDHEVGDGAITPKEKKGPEFLSLPPLDESMKTELNENHFSEELRPEGSLMVSSNESQRDASFGSTVGETINIDNISHQVKNTNEINDVAVDGNDVGANAENDIEIILKEFQASDLQTEVKQSSDLFKDEDDDASEMGKIDKFKITDAHCKQTHTETDTSMPESDISHFESQVIPDVVIDGSARKSNGAECRNIDPVSDMNEDKINSNIKLYEEQNTSVDTSTDSHEARDAQLSVKAAEDLASKHISDSSINAEPSAQQDSAVEADSGGDPGGEASGITAMPVQDQSGSNSVKLSSSGIDNSADSHEVQGYAQLLVKAAEDLAGKYASHSSINTKPSAQHDSSVEVNTGEKHGGEVSGITAVPVQDQSGNNSVKLSSSGIDASVDSGSRCDSMDGNWGSVSVLSMQSDAPAVIDAEIVPSTRSLESRQAGKSNLKIPQAATDRHQSEKTKMFEPPSFMTLVEPSHVVSPKGAASEVQNPQQPNFTSQAGWFPTLNQVINDSQGRKKDEEIVAKVTDWSNSKEHTPLKSLLGDATYSNKPKSPKMEENNGSGLTTVNSILCPESPAAQADKGGEAANEWNSPARYPANIKRERRKIKSRPFWIQLVCCSTVDPRRR